MAFRLSMYIIFSFISAMFGASKCHNFRTKRDPTNHLFPALPSTALMRTWKNRQGLTAEEQRREKSLVSSLRAN